MTVTVVVNRWDWQIGYYRTDTHHHLNPVPCVAIKWARHTDGDRHVDNSRSADLDVAPQPDMPHYFDGFGFGK